MRLALAIEIEVPDGVTLDEDRLYVSAVDLGCFGSPTIESGVYSLREAAGERWRIIRSEIHPDPDAIFPPASETG